MCAKKILVAFVALFLTSCASVDQFGSRINDVNANSGDALNDETLLNIVRAAHYQGPHFVAISQVTGGQTESLATGLPNVNFGILGAADKAYHLTNGVTSGVSSGFTAAPIITSQFEQGILAPLDGRQLLLLLGAYPIEAVYYALIGSITIKYHGLEYRYINNPAYNVDTNAHYNPNCRAEQRAILNADRITSAQICNFEKFQNLLDLLIKAGLSAELLMATPADKGKNTSIPASKAISAPSVNKAADQAKGSDGDSKATNQSAKAQWCYIASQAPSYHAQDLFSEFRCGSGKEFPKHMLIDFAGIGEVEVVSLELRSLSGILNYLGKILREELSDKVAYRSTQEGQALAENGPFFRVEERTGSECIAEASYAGHVYCVDKSAHNTALMINLIEQIRNLQISPTDLNAPFTVRLTGGF